MGARLVMVQGAEGWSEGAQGMSGWQGEGLRAPDHSGVLVPRLGTPVLSGQWEPVQVARGTVHLPASG